MPLISVVVPVYKVEPYLHRCVDSILAQSFSDFELILVDDGSPDNCPAICDEYAGKDNRVRVIHKKNGGLSDARNAGIDWAFANSDSEWITFIDSDDWVHPCYLECLYQAAQRCRVEIAVGEFERTSGTAPVVRENMTGVLYTPEAFYIEHRVTATVAWGKLYKKRCFQSVRYPVGKIHEDEFVTYRLLFATETLVYIEAPLYAYFQNDSGIMASGNTRERHHFIEAMDEQAAYYQKNGFAKAYDRHTRLYLTMLRSMYYEEQESTANKALLVRIRRRLGKALRILRCSVEAYSLEYKIAYPIGIELYWLWRAVKKKLTDSK